MKKIKLISSIILTILSTAIGTRLYASPNNDSFEKNFTINPSATLVIIGYSSDIELLTWDKNEMKVVGKITYGEGSAEDINKLVSAFKDLDVKTSSKTISLNLNHFIKSLSAKNNKNTIVLSTGDKITIKGNNVKTSYKIWIPESLSLDINHRYGTTAIADIKGNVDIKLFNNKLTMGSYGESGKFEARYSTLVIGSGGNTEFSIFNSKLTANTFGNVTISSKYSTFVVNKAANAKVTSFQDKLTFEQLNSADIEGKYSTLIVNSDMEPSTFDFFNSKISAKKIKNLKVSLKYSQLTAGDIQKLTIPSSFDSKLNFKTVGSFKCTESKYDQFKLDEITSSAEFVEAFNANIDIANTGSSFNHFSGKFKYGHINLKLNPAIQYNLSYTAKYGQIKVPMEKFTTRLISDKSNTNNTFEGSTSSNTTCNIKLDTFSTNITIE